MIKADDLVISLFSGAGGCSLGFAAAGLKPSVAADIDEDACATYSANLGVDCQRLDLSTEQAVQQVLACAGGRKPFVIVGGPPCQGFSTAGPRNAADPRNRLIFNYLELISRLEPRWFVFENVEGLLTSNNGSDVVQLAAELRGIGYAFRVEKVNFAGYGLPQTRKRVLMVGNRLGQFFELPPAAFSYESGKFKSYTSLPPSPSILDAISDLPMPGASDTPLPYPVELYPTEYAALLRSDVGTVRHHFVSRSDASTLARQLLPGQTMKDLPEALQHESFRRRANRRVRDGMPTEKRGGAPAGLKRLHGHLNSLTITSAATREFIHPTEDRALTLRECARLQSFPDAYQFAGNSMSIARQIGNAIPPLAGSVLARAIEAEDGRAGADIGPTRKKVSGLIGFHLTDADGMSPALAKTSAALKALMSDDELPLLRRSAHG